MGFTQGEPKNADNVGRCAGADAFILVVIQPKLTHVAFLNRPGQQGHSTARDRQDQERLANLRVLLQIEKYIARMDIETYNERLNSAFPAEETQK